MSTGVIDINNASEMIDELVWEAVFGPEGDKKRARWIIWEAAQNLSVKPSSINDLYMARGRGETTLDFTIPAMNLRGMAYDMARSIFATAGRLNARAIICELARSEIGYTDQTPEEFSIVVLAAAIKEKWSGPVFIQGDHYQVKSEVPGMPKEGDIEEVKKLIKSSIESGIYNIDIDMSTLVDLSKRTEREQQLANIKYSVELAQFIRTWEPKGHAVSIGGEIGHIGGKNSTLADFKAFIEGFNKSVGSDVLGVSKIAVQTGTSHGGVVLPDGTLAKVNIDFSVLSEIGLSARKDYKIGGVVQHGASTLPESLFGQFTQNGVLEIHLATEFQNMILDHPRFPKDLKAGMYAWLDKERQKERGEGQTDEQFHYSVRKKAWGKFKRESWEINEDDKKEIRDSLSRKFEFLFKALNVVNSDKLVEKHIKPLRLHKRPSDFGLGESKIENVSDLSD